MRARRRRLASRQPAGAPGAGAVLVLALAALPALGPACAVERPDAPASSRLAVFAASSLTEAFRAIEPRFEAAHPAVDAVFSFAGSQTLRLQIERGAQADVFASADPRHTALLAEAGLAGDQRVFARNELAVIVPLDNPAGIESFRDLRRANRLVLGSEGVPAGAYAREVLARAARSGDPAFAEDVLERLVSEESNVRLVRAKVEMGEADAAIVYRSDAASSRVRHVPVPPEASVQAEYVAAVVAGTANRDAAGAWMDFLGSEAARRALARHGFVVPPP